MLAYVDLHIHSLLSPCSDNDMTPNNIINMAVIKGLDIIAITDHNCAQNTDAVLKCAKNAGIIAVPGMELETSEEVHLVCLFPGLEEVMLMQQIVHESLPEIQNREEIFGSQIIMDKDDNDIGHVKQLLLTASGLSVDTAFNYVNELGGVVLPAHIDRSSYSILSNLGSIPDDLGVHCVEISRGCDETQYRSNHPELKKFKFVKSSDAHHLWDIFERESGLEIFDLSINSLIKALKE